LIRLCIVRPNSGLITNHPEVSENAGARFFQRCLAKSRGCSRTEAHTPHRNGSSLPMIGISTIPPRTVKLTIPSKRPTPDCRGMNGPPVCMSDLLTKHLRDWLAKHYRQNADGYLFTNSNGRPYLSDNVVKYGVHRAMATLGIETPKGIHVGIHCFRHGVTSELLQSGTPIHVVTRLMRHAGRFQGHARTLRAHRRRRRARCL
jgi:hypothetical protein